MCEKKVTDSEVIGCKDGSVAILSQTLVSGEASLGPHCV